MIINNLMLDRVILSYSWILNGIVSVVDVNVITANVLGIELW